jgi:hypothetical protein
LRPAVPTNPPQLLAPQNSRLLLSVSVEFLLLGFSAAARPEELSLVVNFQLSKATAKRATCSVVVGGSARKRKRAVWPGSSRSKLPPRRQIDNTRII